MSQRKRVVFHIGAPKTGTTYLQTLFSRHCDDLRAVGVDYPYAEDPVVIETGACVGNVVRMVFVEGLVTREAQRDGFPVMSRIWNERVVDLIAQVVEKSPFNTVLFSSEAMSGIGREVLLQIRSRLLKHYDCDFVLFVRDHYDHFSSAWRQLLKSRYLQADFETYVQRVIQDGRPSQGIFTPLINYSEAGVPLKVLNYDSFKDRLASELMSVVGIPLDQEAWAAERSSDIFNRSLSPSEACIQLMVNQRFAGTHFPAFVCARMLSRSPSGGAHEKTYDPVIDARLIEHFGGWIEKANQGIHGQPLRTRLREGEELPAARSVDVADLECLLDALRLAHERRTRRRPLLAELVHRWKCLMRPNVPYDFDPDAYLDMHGDVARAEADPYAHYSRNGYLEGRHYRYF